MLRDITLGQYFPGNSILHKLDPRMKIFLIVIYIVSIFAANSPVSFVMKHLYYYNDGGKFSYRIQDVNFPTNLHKALQQSYFELDSTKYCF